MADIVKPHHLRQQAVEKRPDYRDSRWERAVKVFTINQESKYLIVNNVPALGVVKELIALLTVYGEIEEYKLLDEYPCEEFTDVLLVQYKHIDSARVAKRRLDNYYFFSKELHLCYAPEFETLNETREKLIQRRAVVLQKTSNSEQNIAIHTQQQVFLSPPPAQRPQFYHHQQLPNIALLPPHPPPSLLPPSLPLPPPSLPPHAFVGLNTIPRHQPRVLIDPHSNHILAPSLSPQRFHEVRQIRPNVLPHFHPPWPAHLPRPPTVLPHPFPHTLVVPQQQQVLRGRPVGPMPPPPLISDQRKTSQPPPLLSDPSSPSFSSSTNKLTSTTTSCSSTNPSHALPPIKSCVNTTSGLSIQDRMRLHLEENKGSIHLSTTPVQTITRKEGKRKHSLESTSPVESKSLTTSSSHQISVLDTKLLSSESQLYKQVSSSSNSAKKIPVLHVAGRPQSTTNVNRIMYRKTPPQTTSASGRGMSHDKPVATEVHSVDHTVSCIRNKMAKIFRAPPDNQPLQSNPKRRRI